MIIVNMEEEDKSTLLRKRNTEIKFLEQENLTLKERRQDLEKNVSINKEIIGALIDSI